MSPVFNQRRGPRQHLQRMRRSLAPEDAQEALLRTRQMTARRCEDARVRAFLASVTDERSVLTECYSAAEGERH